MLCMNGLEFCVKFKDLLCMMILFIGMVDENIVVQGFNDGLIDCYIKKDNLVMVEWFSVEIEVLQVCYFSNLLSILCDLLLCYLFSFFLDLVIIWFVCELFLCYCFIEYYLYLYFVGVLLFMVDGCVMFMVIEINVSMFMYLENVEVYNVLDVLFKGLYDKQIVLFFWFGDGMYILVCVEWE